MKRYLKIVGLALLAILLTACSNGATSSSSSTGSSSSSSANSSAQSSTASHAIVVTINGTDYTATLNDSQAAQSIISQLPLTQSFRDYSASFDEKISDLDQSVDYNADENSHDPQAGDIAYWAPDNRIVFYWGDVGEYSGIHVIGHFDDSSAITAIQNLSESDQVSIRLAE